MKKLQQFILEAISNTYLFEMAHSREKYLSDIRGLYGQILDNWCLIKYCNMYDEENYNRLHWCGELYAHLDKLWKVLLKKGLDKLKTTEYGFIYNAELDDIDEVIRLLERKWQIENLPKETLKPVAEEFVKALPRICKMISDKKGENIYNYVYNEI